MMTTLQLVSSVLESIGLIAANPAFGIAGSAAKIIPLIGMLSALVAEGETARAEISKLDDQLKAIVASGAPPSDEDWASWDARHQAAKARLQA